MLSKNKYCFRVATILVILTILQWVITYMAVSYTHLQVTQIITSVISGLTLGATILVAKYAGRQQPDKIEKTIGTTITFFALFSIILSLILAFSTGTVSYTHL